MGYQRIFLNRDGKVSVDGATFEDEGLVSFVHGLGIGDNGIYFSKSEISPAFNRPLEFGDLEQIKALKAYQVFAIQEELNRRRLLRLILS